MEPAVTTTPHAFHIPRIRKLSARDPFRWLGRGWSDLTATPALSLSYGLVIALLGYLVSFASWRVPLLVASFVSGFLLVAPLIAIGLYEMSRRREIGEVPTLSHVITSWQRNVWPVVFMGVILGIVMIAWGRLAGILAAITLPAIGPEGHLVSWATLTSPDGATFLALFVGLGALLAVVVFAFTAVSIPMLIDRKVDTVTAVVTSVKAVSGNWTVMLIWALLIVGLTAVGLATGYLGLIVTMPLVGHATWHAYRQTVES